MIVIVFEEINAPVYFTDCCIFICYILKPAAALSQENNQTSSQMYSQWQPSTQDENKSNQCQQQELKNQEQREQQSSNLDVKEHVASTEVQRDVSGSQAPSGLPMQYNPMQVDSKGRQGEQNSGEFSQSSAEMQMQMSGTGHTQIREPERMLNSGRESQFSNMQRFSNQPVTGPEQTGNSANRAKQIPFGSLLPIILPELDKDRAMQLQTLYGKLRVCFFLVSINSLSFDGFKMRPIQNERTASERFPNCVFAAQYGT